MSEKEIIKKYVKEDLTIVWKPALCIHAAECVKRLPGVYDPKTKPWIKPENATVNELKDQIDACPSGALSYLHKNQEKTNMESSKVKIEMKENGPLVVHGDIIVKGKDGAETMRGPITSLCRCGASANKPFCDGQHKKINFTA
jgi:uncharacterized Fe-S cluster protein YjdI/CDGSH-type Zn-finger protein